VTLPFQVPLSFDSVRCSGRMPAVTDPAEMDYAVAPAIQAAMQD
jgi:hypothetical protein